MSQIDDQRWVQLVARDGAARMRFVYAVRTTGIYCRPGCPSRLPRRDNVRFFGSAAGAAAAGFRPCKRCRPDDADAGGRQRRMIARACRLIRASDEPPPLSRLASAVGISPFHLHRVFRRMVGVTPFEYGRMVRRERLDRSLAHGEAVTPALLAAGYGSAARAYADVGGITPGRRRKGGAGERIGYTCRPSPLGQVLVAATGRGLCAVELGDDVEQLVQALQARFPAAQLYRDEARLAGWAGQVLSFLVDGGPEPDLPRDVRGTAFQAAVWAALRRIPPGQTVTYAGLAAALGRPNAARAVAGACAANPLAVLVPCHRVVRGDGGLGGYRWGLARKRWLLDREAGDGD